MTIFNTNKVDFTKENMFFGAEPNMQRYDVFKHPIFEQLTELQLSNFWRPEEVSLQKDRNDWSKLTDAQKFIFTSNLKYQILLDSVQGRGPITAFLPYISLPELESCVLTWDFFEMIHSRSYTHIIKNLYPNPTEIFDTVLEEEEIIKRATSVTGYYDAFIDYCKELERKGRKLTPMVVEGNIPEGTDAAVVLTQAEEYELKKRLYLALVSVNILEGIRFYVSFACNFAFAENKLMEGSAKILSLIARDENIHLTITQHMIKIYRTTDEDPVMKRVIAETEAEVRAMYEGAVNEEKVWANHLFKSGTMIGLNEKLLHEYIEYLANRRLRAIGMEKMFENVSMTQDPLPWMANWLSSKSLQVAPQETEVESYKIGGVAEDVTEDSFTDFKL